MEANIYESGYEDSNLTSSDSKCSSGTSNFQYSNNPTSFTGPKKFKTDREYFVKIPGVTTQKVWCYRRHLISRTEK